jgi:DNA-binding transcriptional LysR family regulator
VFDWNDARYFLAVSRLGSLSAAARQLRVQQSTVGRRLGTLETALETRLFERTPDGYVPTPAGELFVAHAERIESEALAVERQLAGREGQVAGSVRVTAPQMFGFGFLVPLLARLQPQQPNIVVELVAENFALNLMRREADLALRLGRPQQPALVMRKLGIVNDGLYASRAYLESHGPLGDDGTGHSYIDFDETYNHPASAAFVRSRLRGGRCVLKLNGTPGIATAARVGMGIAQLPCWLGDSDDTLVRLKPDHAHPMDLWLVMHRDLRHAARIRVVSEFFVREITRAASQLTGERRRRRGK